MRSGQLVVVVIAIGAMAAPAVAHIEMTVPGHRSQMQKEGPCGVIGSVRGSNVTTYASGQTITVEWDETVDHPGHYRISFDDDGNDFPNPVRSTDAFPTTLLDNIADHAPGHYTQDITLPDIECTNCTLQLVQVMTTTEPFTAGNLYFQCADLSLVRDVPGDDVADDVPPPPGSTGGCAATRGSGAGAIAVLGALLVVARPRRRRAR
jgi:hypothetical protein